MSWDVTPITPQVETVLNGYSTAPPAVRRNLAKLLSHGRLGGTGRVVILPVDQGIVHGPMPSFLANSEAFDPLYLFKLALQAGMSAYAAPLGSLEVGAGLAEYLGLPLIAKLNNEAQFFKPQEPFPALSGDPKRIVERAVALGCIGVGMTIYYGTVHQKQNVEEAAAVFEYARQCGLLSVAWAYPRGVGLEGKDQSLQVTAHAVYCSAVELGADIIKVKPPTIAIGKADDEFGTLPKAVALLKRSALDGRRMVIFSGMEKADDSQVVATAAQIADGGGSGMIIGRNSFKRSFADACKMIEGVAAEFLRVAA